MDKNVEGILTNFKRNLGFTLVELLIVIAILGVLATVLLVVINPLEQIARARDSTRIQAVKQLSESIHTYLVATGSYPNRNLAKSWMQQLVDSGDLQSLIPQVSSSPACWSDASGHAINNYCYDVQPDWSASSVAFVWVKLESQAQKNKCGANTSEVFYGWDSVSGNTCTRCPIYPQPFLSACAP